MYQAGSLLPGRGSVVVLCHDQCSNVLRLPHAGAGWHASCCQEEQVGLLVFVSKRQPGAVTNKLGFSVQSGTWPGWGAV